MDRSERPGPGTTRVRPASSPRPPTGLRPRRLPHHVGPRRRRGPGPGVPLQVSHAAGPGCGRWTTRLRTRDRARPSRTRRGQAADTSAGPSSRGGCHTRSSSTRTTPPVSVLGRVEASADLMQALGELPPRQRVALGVALLRGPLRSGRRRGDGVLGGHGQEHDVPSARAAPQRRRGPPGSPPSADERRRERRLAASERHERQARPLTSRLQNVTGRVLRRDAGAYACQRREHHTHEVSTRRPAERRTLAQRAAYPCPGWPPTACGPSTTTLAATGWRCRRPSGPRAAAAGRGDGRHGPWRSCSAAGRRPPTPAGARRDPRRTTASPSPQASQSCLTALPSNAPGGGQLGSGSWQTVLTDVRGPFTRSRCSRTAGAYAACFTSSVLHGGDAGDSAD